MLTLLSSQLHPPSSTTTPTYSMATTSTTDTTSIDTTDNISSSSSSSSNGSEIVVRLSQRDMFGPSDLSNLRLHLLANNKSNNYKRGHKGLGIFSSLIGMSDIFSLFDDDWSLVSVLRWRLKDCLEVYLRDHTHSNRHSRSDDSENDGNIIHDNSTHIHNRKRRKIPNGCLKDDYVNDDREDHWHCTACYCCKAWIDRMEHDFYDGHASVTFTSFLKSRQQLIEFILALSKCVRSLGHVSVADYGLSRCIYIFSDSLYSVSSSSVCDASEERSGIEVDVSPPRPLFEITLLLHSSRLVPLSPHLVTSSVNKKTKEQSLLPCPHPPQHTQTSPHLNSQQVQVPFYSHQDIHLLRECVAATNTSRSATSSGGSKIVYEDPQCYVSYLRSHIDNKLLGDLAAGPAASALFSVTPTDDGGRDNVTCASIRDSGGIYKKLVTDGYAASKWEAKFLYKLIRSIPWSAL